MSARLQNGLDTERARLGWTQARMAEAAGISRQSYAAIESGASVPSTEVALRLALAVGRPVEELFRLPELPPERRTAGWAGSAPPAVGHRVRLIPIAGRWVAHPCADAHRPPGLADGVVARVEGEEVTVALLPDPAPAPGLAVVGCDPAFGVVADELAHARGIDVIWSQRGSREALLALARGEAHVAGSHLFDASSGTWNDAWVREMVPFPTTRISFAVWDQGLLVRPTPGRAIRGVEDLRAPRLRLLNREVGSGSRALLDETLERAGMGPDALEGYDTAARGHLAVADGLAAGLADVGVAIRAAALTRGLDFVPLRREAYDLVVPDHFLDLPEVGALLDVLRRPGVRAKVEALGGYDAAAMGRESAQAPPPPRPSTRASGSAPSPPSA